MSKSCFIYETLNDVKSLNIKKDDNFMHLSGVFGVCGVKNNNERIYEARNYGKMVKEMQERIKVAPIPGELEHPKSMNINLENISHRIDSISIDENGVVSGQITLLDTPKGKIAQAIVEGGLPLFISSRAQGSVDPSTKMVKLESLMTYDLVGTPGFSQAQMHLNENQVAESICESVYYVTENDNKEKNIENIEMENELLEKLNELESKYKYIVEKCELLEKENKSIKESIEYEQESLVNGVEAYIKDFVIEKLQKVEKWIMEEYSAEVSKWITEEFAGDLQKWVFEEYSASVSKWITEEYTPTVENWLSECFTPDLTNKFTKEINEKLNESKESKLKNIDNILTLLEEHKEAKPIYQGHKQTLLTESVDLNEPKYIREMPAAIRAKWDLASDDVKESIKRRAKIYNFVNEGAIEKFWESVDFENTPQIKNIYEGLDKIENTWEKNIRLQLRKRFNKG